MSAPPQTVTAASNTARPNAPQQVFFLVALRHQLLPLAKRHGAIADCRHLSEPADIAAPQPQPNRTHQPHLSDHGIVAAAVHWHFHRQTSEAVFVVHRHGLYSGRHARAFARSQLSKWCLVGGALVGVGSSVFHPESSRIARLASGGQHGMAQSVFQVGGNGGSSLGPLLAALVVTPYGQGSVAWFAPAAILGILILGWVGTWYKSHLVRKAATAKHDVHLPVGLSTTKVWLSLGLLIALMFSKFFYLASLSNYYTFFLIKKFGVPVATSQKYLFVFLFSTAVGTILGGPIGDRIGRRLVIWISILGVLPFTLLLPHLNLFWTGIVTVPIGLILSSAFSAIVVYAQDLLPGRVGMVSGIFFGLAFGLGGIGAAALGTLADHTSVEYVYQLCAYLPAIGFLAAFLPNFKNLHHAAA